VGSIRTRKTSVVDARFEVVVVLNANETTKRRIIMDIAEEIRLLEFDTCSAQRYAREGRLEEWIHRYCNAGSWANPGLSEGLKKQRRWWNGPLEVSLCELNRCVGPEPGMEYPVDPASWRIRITPLAASMGSSLSVPPLMAEYRGGVLSLRDGNTRHGAMCKLGWKTCWVIIWYNSIEDYRQHSQTLNGGGVAFEPAALDEGADA
jgi:hypothetical protein